MRRVAAAAAALLVACGGGGSEEPANPLAAVAGTYTLRTAGGAALPVVVDQSESGSLEVDAETLTLEPGGTWARTTDARISVPASALPGGVAITPTTVTDGGAYTLAGSALTLTSGTSGVAAPATVSGGQITQTRFNKTFVYAR